MGRKIRAAAIQMDVTPAPVSQRLQRAATLLAEATAAGAQLVVLPELFNTGYEFHERNYALAERLDGETVTWMKAMAAEHNLHLVGSLLLRDGADIYNSAILTAPNGRIWRYDKQYIPFWERAYFRGGEQITVADTDLGKLGMMICWDHAHPDLWANYAGNVDAILIMSCPGDIGGGDLLFPDGFRTKFMNLVQPQMDEMSATDSSNEQADPIQQQAAWMDVPVVGASATGTIRTKLPLIETIFPTSPLAERTVQAADMLLECGFPPATEIRNAQGQLIVQGTVTGDGVIFAELDLAEQTPQPQTAQPKINIAPEMYQLSDEIIPAMMIPLYEDGLKRPY